MTKLAESIKALEPECLGTMPDHDTQDVIEFVSRKDFERVRTIAILLAEALEKYYEDSDGVSLCAINHAEDAFTKAQQILGGE